MITDEHPAALEVAIEQSDFPVCITGAALDPPGPTTLYVNEAFVRLTGYARDALIGATPRLHQGPVTDRAELDRLKATLAAGQVFDGDVWNIHRDGTAYEVAWRIIPLRLGGEGIDHFVSIQRDVTRSVADWDAIADEGARLSERLHAAAAGGHEPRLDNRPVTLIRDLEARIRARERALRTYQAVFESSRDAVVFTDQRGRFTDMNPAAMALFDIPDRETFLRDFPTPDSVSPRFQPDGRRSDDAARELIAEAFEHGEVLFEWQQQSATGRRFPVEILLSRIDLDDGPILESTVRDISDRHAAMTELRRARDRAETYFEAMPVMVLVIDMQGVVMQINQRGCELLEVSREEVIGARWADRFVPKDEARRLMTVFEAFRQGRVAFNEYRENTVLTANGEPRTMAFRNVPLRDESGAVERILASGIDVTRQRAIEADLEYRASHDPLTGLFNRRRMTERLEAERRRVQRHGGTFSVILFDVDHFKAINDEYGHDRGDSILGALAGVVGECLRETDSLGRWGGEEFLALLPDTSGDHAASLAEQYRQRIEVHSFAGSVSVTISVGVATFAPDESIERLLKRVDGYAYAAKHAGRNRTRR
jgi:diguanylate cyclase (GGDEF)-like protein/PAS domain S-box-containing protein